MKIFLDETTNTSQPVKLGSAGTYKMIAEGTWGGATVTPQVSVDGTNYVALGTGLTADGFLDFTSPGSRNGVLMRVLIAGGTGAELSVDIFPVDYRDQ